MTKQRSDGSLVRITTLVEPGETWESGDVVLKEFALNLEGELGKYIPE